MTEAKKLQFEQPKSKAEKRRESGRASTNKKPRLKDRVPTLPKRDVQVSDLKTADQRAIACANMRLNGAPYHEIARVLDYADAASARAAFISALARMNPPEDLETLRQSEAIRSELLFQESFAMARAQYLVVRDKDGNEIERVPNTDRLRWHEQAGKDLALHATITGAKAPTRLEVSASTQELNRMVHVLVQANGGTQDAEADIWDIDQIEAIDAEIVEEED